LTLIQLQRLKLILTICATIDLHTFNVKMCRLYIDNSDAKESCPGTAFWKLWHYHRWNGRSRSFVCIVYI